MSAVGSEDGDHRVQSLGLFLQSVAVCGFVRKLLFEFRRLGLTNLLIGIPARLFLIPFLEGLLIQLARLVRRCLCIGFVLRMMALNGWFTRSVQRRRAVQGGRMYGSAITALMYFSRASSFFPDSPSASPQ